MRTTDSEASVTPYGGKLVSVDTPYAIRFYPLRVSNPERMRVLAEKKHKAYSTMYRTNNSMNASWLRALALCLRFYVVSPSANRSHPLDACKRTSSHNYIKALTANKSFFADL